MIGPSVAASALWVALGACLVTALACALLSHARAVIALLVVATIVVGLASFVSGLALLSGSVAPRLALPSPLPVGPLLLRPDRLGAFYLVVIGLVAAPIGLYSWGYLQSSEHFGHLRAFASLWLLLLAALILIVCSADGVLFLMAWEVMAFLSYLLVLQPQLTARA